MFKTFAAATATVALALGLSLVAIAPANADDTVPPTTDTVATDTTTPPPADTTTPPPADTTTAPPADTTTPPPADTTTPPPADTTTTAPPADDSTTAPPAADTTTPPPADVNAPPVSSLAPQSAETHAHNPVTLCHATPADTAAEGWHTITVDDDSVFKEGHAGEHDADIIPAFDYWTEDHGVWTENHFDGKNLDTVFSDGKTGQQILDNDCKIGLTAAAAATGETCNDDALVPGYITVTLDDHLVYSIDNGASFDATGKTGPLVTGGTYTVTVKVLPQYKNDFTVTPTSFVFTIAAFDGECGGSVGASVAPAAAATNQTCNADDPEDQFLVNGYITVFTLDKISYVITADSDAGQTPIPYDSVTGKTGPLAAGAYTIVPSAKPTFELTSTDALHRTILAFDGKCQLSTDAVVIPLVQKDPGCSAIGSYTLSNNVNDPTAVIWTVNGSTVAAGPHTVAAPATVTVHADANAPAFGLDGTPQVDWTLTFADPATCGNLKTLALTGTQDGTPMLAASALMMLLGVALVRSGLRARRRNAAS